MLDWTRAATASSSRWGCRWQRWK
uniref:Uncharacterized protein MANES_10G031200 n=1 Tax=Rhizophora mucronata TaxID=61149 RepID=A0A2P2PA91_RHIMU